MTGEYKDYYPKEWQDDETMSVLFSPFRDNRDVNPTSWDRKLKFWTDLILKDRTHCGCAIVDVKALPHEFLRKGKIPVCLTRVLQEMLKNGKLEPLTDYSFGPPPGWISWGASLSFNYLVKKPFSWVINTAIKTSEPTELAASYVVPDIVKSKAAEVLQTHSEGVKKEELHNMIEYWDLRHKCADICPHDQTFELAVQRLHRDGKVQVAEDKDKRERILKFGDPTKRKVSQLSDVEQKVFKLKRTEVMLEKEITKMSSEMDRCRTEAKYYLGQGLRSAAKCALRRKKRFEKLVEQKQHALESIRTLQQSIQDTESAKMIIDAYSAGTSAFKEMSAKYGLQTDKIEKIMDDVNEVLDDEADMAETMSASVGDSDPAMADLEQELEKLLEDFGSEEDGREQMGDTGDLAFPDVPTHDPVTPPGSTVMPPGSRQGTRLKAAF